MGAPRKHVDERRDGRRAHTALTPARVSGVTADLSINVQRRTDPFNVPYSPERRRRIQRAHAIHSAMT